MTAKDYAKKYQLYPTWQKVAEEAFRAGLKQGREESKSKKQRKLEKELAELREYKKEAEEYLSDPDKLIGLAMGL